ncbi:metallo-mystery pair system four-Cys motif protein [Rhodobacteraceae bacterium 2376]|uniref:Metallo-mystery pair system four-Cys motif protein n=1 Tax=Rhabdonatronobacter sediminivivens TaxID=2743469 RepID=A0A7Z0I1I2_9RHOB|nr:metallo-mystery pair system four-Cys motif protein [Rhabdonatronobacter sediminivivens]
MLALAVTTALATPALADQPVTINFAAEMAGTLFTCAQAYEGIGVTDSTVEVADFRVFVTNARLIGADRAETPIALDQDGIWQLDNVALLDFEDATGTCVNGTPDMNTSLRGTVPAGEYTGLAFDIGVPFELNHGDPTLAASPLNLTAMFWNWQGGYKFIKIELSSTGLPVTHDANRGWALHLGSTGCASEARTVAPEAECANPNLVDVRFDSFDPAADTVIPDVAPVLAEANVDMNIPETSPGCMSFLNDDDCMPVMSRLGLPFRDIAAGEQLFATMR